MCETCGCQDALSEHHHEHSHEHSHEDDHGHKHSESRIISVGKDLLSENRRLADENSKWLSDRGIRALNLISSPGSGKTLLIEKTFQLLGEKGKHTCVLTGDLQTDQDAARIGKVTDRVRQINTVNSCHLDAKMVQENLPPLIRDGDGTKLLLIENVGNLVCPAVFELGEDEMVALLSVTEGEDKPIKYPVLFSRAKLVLITKIDLVPHLDWSLEKCKGYIRQINPKAEILTLSAKTGDGMEAWIDYLRAS